MGYEYNYEIVQILNLGTPEEKFLALEQIRLARDVCWISLLVELLEKENQRSVKEHILTVLNCFIPLAAEKKLNVTIDIDYMLRSSDPFVRNGVVELIKHSGMSTVHFFERLANDQDKDIRKFVLDALSLEKSEKSIEIIRKGLNDPEINIVYTAIEYLGNFRDVISADKIENHLLSTNNKMVICASLEALAKIGESPHKEQILDTFMTKDLHPVITFALLKYLGSFGGFEALDFIEYLLDTNGEMFAKEIIDSIESIVKNDKIKSISRELRQKLKNLCHGTSNCVNKYALMKLLIKTTGDNNEEISNQLEQIRVMLHEENDMVRLCAIEVLAEIGVSEDVEQLEELARKTENSELLEAIGDAVSRINDRK